MITPFTFASLPVTPWKNGAGETREIVSIPSADAPFLWRASIATLAQEGPFSLFPGVDRVIMLLGDAGLWLRGDDLLHRLEPGVPWAFPGEWRLATEGVSGPGMDFNVMTQRSRASAEVTIATTAQQPGAEGIAFVLKGDWQLAGNHYSPASGIWWQGETPGAFMPHSEEASLLLADIRRHNEIPDRSKNE